MKRILKTLAFFLILLTSCREEQLPEYNNRPGLYFFRESYSGANVQRDSVSFMFFAKAVRTDSQYVQYIDVRTVGFPENRDRRFTLVQTNLGEDNAAIPGVHYVAFDDPLMEQLLVIPANATEYNVPVICKNDASLSAKKVRLKIAIGENENFKVGIHAQKEFVINFTDMAVRPNTWVDDKPTMNWFPWFGYWSAVKMRLISMTLGFYDFDYEYDRTLDFSFLKDYYARKMYRLVREYNEAHPGNPMRDENNNLIEFPVRYAN
jgi:hypothetical protein